MARKKKPGQAGYVPPPRERTPTPEPEPEPDPVEEPPEEPLVITQLPTYEEGEGDFEALDEPPPAAFQGSALGLEDAHIRFPEPRVQRAPHQVENPLLADKGGPWSPVQHAPPSNTFHDQPLDNFHAAPPSPRPPTSPLPSVSRVLSPPIPQQPPPRARSHATALSPAPSPAPFARQPSIQQVPIHSPVPSAAAFATPAQAKSPPPFPPAPSSVAASARGGRQSVRAPSTVAPTPVPPATPLPAPSHRAPSSVAASTRGVKTARVAVQPTIHEQEPVPTRSPSPAPAHARTLAPTSREAPRAPQSVASVASKSGSKHGRPNPDDHQQQTRHNPPPPKSATLEPSRKHAAASAARSVATTYDHHYNDFDNHTFRDQVSRAARSPSPQPVSFPQPVTSTPLAYFTRRTMPTDAEIAAEILSDESQLRFPAFSTEEAVTIGMSIRKRFRASVKYARGKGLVIAIQDMQGSPMFACGVGEGSDVSLDSWMRLEGMIKVVRRTGHSTYYVEKGIAAIAKTADQLGLPFPEYRIEGGAFPIWLQNAPSTPIGVIAVYSGSSHEDHQLVIHSLRHYFSKTMLNGARRSMEAEN